MQVYTSKNILLITLLFLSTGLFAQVVPKKYITRSGDTTVIVSATTGLRGEEARFLLDSKASDGQLSKSSRFRQLKDASDETEQLANMVDVEKRVSNPSSGSMSFRVAQRNIRHRQNEEKASRLAYDANNRDVSVEEMLFMKRKFNNKPSYFVNGVHVDPEVASAISTKDILTRSLKVANTITGNPNGEIWYVVNSKTFAQLGLEEYEQLAIDNNILDRPQQTKYENPYAYRNQSLINNLNVLSIKEYNRLTPAQQQRILQQQQEIKELQEQIERVRQQRMSTYANRPKTTNDLQYRRSAQREEIVGFRDSPQERTRRERDELENSPQRSVRRIKDRERNR